MKRLLTLSVLVFVSFTLVGCFSKSSTSISDTEISVSSEQAAAIVAVQDDTLVIQGEFSVSSCNAYVNLMKCVIEKTDPSSQVQQKKSFEDLLDLWRSLNNSQLTQACDMNMQVIQQQKEIIEKIGCMAG